MSSRSNKITKEACPKASLDRVKSQVWRVKPRADDRQDPETSAAPVNMVFMLPSEFVAPDSDKEEPDLEEGVAQLNLEPVSATFEKLEDEKRKHLKALFLKGYVDGKPITRMMVDGVAAVNIMPYAMLRKIRKSNEVLTKTDMMLKDFDGVVSPAVGALCIDLTISSASSSDSGRWPFKDFKMARIDLASWTSWPMS